MIDLLTVDQAEDAGATALAFLITEGLNQFRSRLPAGDRGRSVAFADLTAVCRDLLRGPLAEDGSRRPGGYCMKARTDPTLRALGRFGATAVEISYTDRKSVV